MLNLRISCVLVLCSYSNCVHYAFQGCLDQAMDIHRDQGKEVYIIQ